MTVPRTLVVTGHFPPEPGGVQTFTWEFVRRLPSDRIAVVAPAWPGAAEFDAGLPFPVYRRHGYLLFSGLRDLVRRHRSEVGWITAMAPFGLYAPLVRRAGLRRVVASSHGQEIGWIRAWPTRLAFRAMTAAVDTLTYLSDATLAELRAAVAPNTPLVQLAGGVDINRFRPDVDGTGVRQRHGLGRGPVILSVARLVRRKGADTLVDAWPAVLAAHPRARLVIVGEGPMLEPLRAVAQRRFPDSVTVTGAVAPADLPGYYAAADVFALPCRDDRRGLQTEGLGLSVLEASAAGLPVVVGRSGGSPHALLPGRTGLLVDAERPEPVAGALLELLGDPAGARTLGEAGRAWTAARWTWDLAVTRLAAVLRGEPSCRREKDAVR